MRNPATGVRIAIAALAVAGALAPQAFAQQSNATVAEIERYRQMLQDGNPAELVSAKGEGMWAAKRGPKNASLEKCDLGMGPGVVKGAYAKLPRYFADTDQVMDFESRLVAFSLEVDGRPRRRRIPKSFASLGTRLSSTPHALATPAAVP